MSLPMAVTTTVQQSRLAEAAVDRPATQTMRFGHDRPPRCYTSQAPVMTNGQFLTTEQVLDSMQVNLRTVYRLTKAGKIPAVRAGRQWLCRRSDIGAWRDISRQGPGASNVASTGDERLQVLVVNDEPVVRELLAKVLARILAATARTLGEPILATEA